MSQKAKKEVGFVLFFLKGGPSVINFLHLIYLLEVLAVSVKYCSWN